MSLQDLSLPTDVPWKLIATSPDMLASHNSRFPYAMWKNSLAVFAYTPDLTELADEFPDREISFLKVVCSLTSYTPPCGSLLEPSPPDPSDYVGDSTRYPDAYAAWTAQVAAIQETEGKPYPCCGALVQVAVYPRRGETDVNDASSLAYFASFEPQKRELIEVVTESGESMTQSHSDLNVRKGVTATDSTEDLDVFTGANANVGFGGAQVGVGVSGQWGTIKKATTERVDSTTTDTSREARETSSHTTSLSQLYHLLNSYHVGTNRAIFFIQPRPHTVQQKDRFTFIQGPQEIEGIQEFFLVLVRPKGSDLVKDYCVDALLYTAHLEPDDTSSAVLASKVAETPWVELMRSVKTIPQPGWSIGDIIAAIFGVPPEIVAGINTLTLQNPQATDAPPFDQQQDQAPVPPGEEVPDMQAKTTYERTFYAPAGFKVDRTRGLGGYDLWEDPANITDTPLGDRKDSTPPPQAFVEILAQGSPDDLANYRPDSVLHVQAFLYTTGGPKMYHAYIKVYWIRDDSSDNLTKVDMLVTARGVSTCPDSVSVFYADVADPSKMPADIAAEHLIYPPHIAPWHAGIQGPTVAANASTAVPSGNAPSGAGGTSWPPNQSSMPSGHDQASIAAARAKMSNAIADRVHWNMKKTFRCLGFVKRNIYTFRQSDLFFNKVASRLLSNETRHLATVAQEEPRLVNSIASHPTLPRLAGAASKVFAGVRGAGQSKPETSPPVASKRFPLISLGAKTLTSADRKTLHGAGIHSGLDLLHMPAERLAARLGVDHARARQIRLRAIGLESGDGQ